MTDSAVVNAIARVACPGVRCLVAIAGPPGAGKSTLAEALAHDFSLRGLRPKVVPMDGFHLDNHTLEARGLQARKGAPDTFDATGFVALVERLRVADVTVTFPTFDRASDCVVPDADAVTSEHDLLLIEGNYLLLEAAPWNQLKALFDYSVMLNPGLQVLEERLVARWQAHDHTRDAARKRAESNDLPNARHVIALSMSPDIVVDAA